MFFLYPINYREYVTREEFCDISLRLYCSIKGLRSADGISESPGNTFSDTNKSSILKAHYLGIVKGYGDRTFKPNDRIPREQLATMLFRTVLLADDTIDETGTTTVVNEFTDRDDIADYALEPVRFFTRYGVINGTSETTFSPDKNATRQEAIKMAVVAANMKGEYRELVNGRSKLLQYGDTGKYVEELQSQLVDLNECNHMGIGEIDTSINFVDGIFGAKTKAAVEFFQRLGGINIDGIVGKDSYELLHDEARIEKAFEESAYNAKVSEIMENSSKVGDFLVGEDWYTARRYDNKPFVCDSHGRIVRDEEEIERLYAGQEFFNTYDLKKYEMIKKVRELQSLCRKFDYLIDQNERAQELTDLYGDVMTNTITTIVDFDSAAFSLTGKSEKIVYVCKSISKFELGQLEEAFVSKKLDEISRKDYMAAYIKGKSKAISDIGDKTIDDIYSEKSLTLLIYEIEMFEKLVLEYLNDVEFFYYDQLFRDGWDGFVYTVCGQGFKLAEGSYVSLMGKIDMEIVAKANVYGLHAIFADFEGEKVEEYINERDTYISNLPTYSKRVDNAIEFIKDLENY